MLGSDLCDHSDPYVVEKGTIDLLSAAENENDKAEKNAALKTNPPFRSCTSKVNSTLTESPKDRKCKSRYSYANV